MYHRTLRVYNVCVYVYMMMVMMMMMTTTTMTTTTTTTKTTNKTTTTTTTMTMTMMMMTIMEYVIRFIKYSLCIVYFQCQPSQLLILNRTINTEKWNSGCCPHQSFQHVCSSNHGYGFSSKRFSPKSFVMLCDVHRHSTNSKV